MNTSIVSWRWLLLMALVRRRDQLLDIAVSFHRVHTRFKFDVVRRKNIGQSEHSATILEVMSSEVVKLRVLQKSSIDLVIQCMPIGWVIFGSRVSRCIGIQTEVNPVERHHPDGLLTA